MFVSSAGLVFQSGLAGVKNCGEWNSLVEQVVSSGGSSVVDKSAGRGKALKTSSIREAASESGLERLISTGIDDLDTVLGGGFLVGGVVLVAGQPGIGKSTLLAQVAAYIASKSVLYVSGEESVSQVKLRVERLGAADSEKCKASVQ